MALAGLPPWLYSKVWAAPVFGSVKFMELCQSELGSDDVDPSSIGQESLPAAQQVIIPASVWSLMALFMAVFITAMGLIMTSASFEALLPTLPSS